MKAIKGGNRLQCWMHVARTEHTLHLKCVQKGAAWKPPPPLPKTHTLEVRALIFNNNRLRSFIEFDAVWSKPFIIDKMLYTQSIASKYWVRWLGRNFIWNYPNESGVSSVCMTFPCMLHVQHTRVCNYVRHITVCHFSNKCSIPFGQWNWKNGIRYGARILKCTVTLPALMLQRAHVYVQCIGMLPRTYFKGTS